MPAPGSSTEVERGRPTWLFQNLRAWRASKTADFRWSHFCHMETQELHMLYPPENERISPEK